MWRWPRGKSAALALDLPGSIPGHSPIFRVALALLLLSVLDLIRSQTEASINLYSGQQNGLLRTTLAAPVTSKDNN